MQLARDQGMAFGAVTGFGGHGLGTPALSVCRFYLRSGGSMPFSHVTLGMIKRRRTVFEGLARLTDMIFQRGCVAFPSETAQQF
ncbi:MAG: hypothetical protein AAFW83_08455 [Pseudomonadota bacterium]